MTGELYRTSNPLEVKLKMESEHRIVCLRQIGQGFEKSVDRFAQ